MSTFFVFLHSWNIFSYLSKLAKKEQAHRLIVHSLKRRTKCFFQHKMLFSAYHLFGITKKAPVVVSVWILRIFNMQRERTRFSQQHCQDQVLLPPQSACLLLRSDPSQEKPNPWRTQQTLNIITTATHTINPTLPLQIGICVVKGEMSCLWCD